MEEALTFAAVGDIALSHNYEELIKHKGPDYPFDHVRSFFWQKDIVFANLEGPLGISGKPYPLKCSLKAAPDYVKGLKNAGINVVSLANNHILDYREDAMYETMQLLEEHGILFFGAGSNLAEARRPAILEKKGIRVGFLGYCDVVIDSPFYAGPNERGVSPFVLEYVKQDIHALRPRVDLLALSLHWGMENFSLPLPEQIRMGRELIDSGADIILGHHPHVVQRLEQYKQGYIAYSLGNFLFSDIDWSWHNEKGERKQSRVVLSKRNKRSLILSFSFNGRIESMNGSNGRLNGNHQVKIIPAKPQKIVHADQSSMAWDRYKYFLYRSIGLLKKYSKPFERRIRKAVKIVIGSNG